MKAKNFKSEVEKSSFTLVELLVVISLISILAALTFVSYVGVQRQARDSQRKSDLRQYQGSLEVFANRSSGLYPQRNNSSGVSATTLCTDLGMTGCSQDPRNTSDQSFDYRYQSDGSSSTGQPTALRYVLWAKIENTQDYWVVCSNGKTGIQPQGTFSVSAGNCPI